MPSCPFLVGRIGLVSASQQRKAYISTFPSARNRDHFLIVWGTTGYVSMLGYHRSTTSKHLASHLKCSLSVCHHHLSTNARARTLAVTAVITTTRKMFVMMKKTREAEEEERRRTEKWELWCHTTGHAHDALLAACGAPRESGVRSCEVVADVASFVCQAPPLFSRLGRQWLLSMRFWEWALYLAVSALAVGRWGVADAASVDVAFEVKGSEMQGRRPYQEDRHAVHLQQVGGMHYFGVFDGHGGSQASSFAVERLHEIVSDHLDSLLVGSGRDEGQGSTSLHNGHDGDTDRGETQLCSDVASCLEESYRKLDTEFLAQDMASGSTALVALLDGRSLWVANTGDCRGVLSRGGTAVALSDDHKPNRPDELVRIRAAGSWAEEVVGVWRVERTLAMSRAIGDRHLKHVVIPDPEVKHFGINVVADVERNRELGRAEDDTVDRQGDDLYDEFVILASDGLWDVMSNQEAVDFVRQNPHLMTDAMAAARALVMLAYQLGSMDNITVLFIRFIGTDAGDGPDNESVNVGAAHKNKQTLEHREL